MSVLEDAHQLVHGDRNEAYGHPLQDFQRVAVIWSGVLNILVTPEQVGLCLIGLKLAREAYQPSRDTRVDLAGYAECLDMIAHAKEHPQLDPRSSLYREEGPHWTPPTTAPAAAAPSVSPEPSESVPAATPSIPDAVRVESEICPKCQRFQHPAPHRCDP